LVPSSTSHVKLGSIASKLAFQRLKGFVRLETDVPLAIAAVDTVLAHFSEGVAVLNLLVD